MKTIYIYALFSFFIIFFLIGCSKETKSINCNSPELIVLNIHDFFDDYNENELNFNNKYVNKCLEVTWEIGSIHEVNGHAQITFFSNSLGFNSITAEFKTEYNTQISNLNIGDKITVLGIMMEPDENLISTSISLNFDLVDCSLVPTNNTQLHYCDNCGGSLVFYDCDKEGGVVELKINNEEPIISGGYILANQITIQEPQQFFYFAGNPVSCYNGNIRGGTESSSVKFGVSEFDIYNVDISFWDFCKNEVNYFIEKGEFEISKFENQLASGSLSLEFYTNGANDCQPAQWNIQVDFDSVPVYF